MAEVNKFLENKIGWMNVRMYMASDYKTENEEPASKGMHHSPEAPASPWSLLEMQVLQAHHRTTVQDSLGAGHKYLCFHKLLIIHGEARSQSLGNGLLPSRDTRKASKTSKEPSVCFEEEFEPRFHLSVQTAMLALPRNDGAHGLEADRWRPKMTKSKNESVN
jgi:hypothetical protein